MTGSARNDQDKIRVSVTLNLSKKTIGILDKLKMEYEASTRSRVIEMLIQDLIAPEE